MPPTNSYIINCSIFLYNVALSLIIFDEKRTGVGILFFNILFVLMWEYVGKSKNKVLYQIFQLIEEFIITTCVMLLVVTTGIVVLKYKISILNFNYDCETLFKIKVNLVSITFLIHTTYMIFIKGT